MHRPSSVRAAIAAGAVALVAALVPLSALAAAPHKDAGFQGFSTQKSGNLTLPVDLRVAKDGKSVTRFDIQWTSKCASPTGRGSLGGLSVTLKKPVSKVGSFGDTSKFTRDFGGGQTGQFTVTLVGKFTKKTLAKGTFHVTVSIHDATNTQIDTCDSGQIGWQARD